MADDDEPAFSVQRSRSENQRSAFSGQRSDTGADRVIAVVVAMAGLAGAAAAQGSGQNAPIAKALVPYTTCSFPDGLRVVQTALWRLGWRRGRADGERTQSIEMEAAEQVTFVVSVRIFLRTQRRSCCRRPVSEMKRILLRT